MHRRLIFLSALLVAAALVAIPLAQAQGGSTPRLLFQANVPGVRLNKFPDVAAFARTVHIASNNNRTDAVYVSKGDSAQTFSTPEVLGPAPGQADFSPTTIATASDGSVHYAWLNQNTRQILYRNKPANGTWGPTRIAHATSGSGFPASLNMGVASDGAIFIAWREADAPMRVKRSTDGGVNWSGPILLGTTAGINFPYVITGPTGQVAIPFTSGQSDRLQIFIAFWNGSNFDIQRVSQLVGDFADPSGAYDPAGNLFIAWRGTDKTGDQSGVFVAAYQGGSNWQINRVVGPSEVYDMVNLQSDEQGNLHLAWIAIQGEGQRVYYSFRPRGSTAFSSIVSAPNPGGSIFNARLAANVGDEAYGHALAEFFAGDGVTTSLRYNLFAAGQVQPAIGAQPVIEDSKAVIGRKESVQVSFLNVQGTPAQVRWRWGSPPDDSTNDSNGWQAFANPLTVPVPQSVLDQTTCAPATLYTQVRDAQNVVEPAGKSDAIVVDTGISASLTATNPYSRKSPEFTPAADATLGDSGLGAASDGDPGYTRDPIFYLELRGREDCSGLKDVATGRSTTSIAPAYKVEKEFFANVLPMAGQINPGPNQMVVRVGDAAGNFSDYPQSLIYDPQKPVLGATPGTLAVVSDSKTTLIAQLNFTDVSASDNLYPGRGFWGVWIANSREQLSAPSGDAELNWIALRAPGDGSSFTIDGWSLGTGLSDSDLTPGTYYVYVRLLDGAGNPTDGYLTASVTLTEVSRPRLSLPLLAR